MQNMYVIHTVCAHREIRRLFQSLVKLSFTSRKIAFVFNSE